MSLSLIQLFQGCGKVSVCMKRTDDHIRDRQKKLKLSLVVYQWKLEGKYWSMKDLTDEVYTALQSFIL